MWLGCLAGSLKLNSSRSYCDLLDLGFCFALLITGSLAALQAILLKFVADYFCALPRKCRFLALRETLG